MSNINDPDDPHHQTYYDDFSYEEPQNDAEVVNESSGNCGQTVPAVTTPPNAVELKEMMDVQQEVDHIHQFRRRESNEAIIVKEEGISPIKTEDDGIVVKKFEVEDNSLEDMFKYLCTPSPLDVGGGQKKKPSPMKKLGTGNASADKKVFLTTMRKKVTKKEAIECKMINGSSSGGSPCQCPKCDVGGGQKKKSHVSRYLVAKETIEAPLPKKDRPDGTALPICREGRIACNCAYCKWRRSCDATGHVDNSYHRTNCTSCVGKYWEKNDVQDIVAMFHISCDFLFQVEKKCVVAAELAAELVRMLGEAISERSARLWPKIGYIERDNSVHNQHFVVTITSEAIAQKLRKLKVNQSNFEIVEPSDKEFEDLQLMWYYDSVEDYYNAVTTLPASEVASKSWGKNQNKGCGNDSGSDSGNEELAVNAEDASSNPPEEEDDDFDSKDESSPSDESEHTSDGGMDESEHTPDGDTDADDDDEDEDGDMDEDDDDEKESDETSSDEGRTGVVVSANSRADSGIQNEEIVTKRNVLRPWQKRGERVVATSVPKNAHPLEKVKQGKPIVAKGKKRTLKPLSDSEAPSEDEEKENTMFRKVLPPSSNRRPTLFGVSSLVHKKVKEERSSPILHQSTLDKHLVDNRLFQPSASNPQGNHRDKHLEESRIFEPSGTKPSGSKTAWNSKSPIPMKKKKEDFGQSGPSGTKFLVPYDSEIDYIL